MIQRPFEHRLGEWLEEGPVRAPDTTLDTVLAALPSIRQRRPWLVLGGRSVVLSPRVRLALSAAAVVIIALAGVRLLGTFPGPGLSPPIELTTHTSFRYHYSIGYPTGWSVREAARSLRADETPWADGDAVDRFEARDFVRTIIVAAANVTPGTSPKAWAASTTLAICGIRATEEPITIDGEPGLLYTYDQCYSYFHQWAVVVHGGSAFHIVWLGTSGDREVDRAAFEQVLATFRFD